MHLKGVPNEFLTNFDSHRPVVVGGLLPSETAMGFINARVKKHRWHKRILKSNDPLIFSVGWRRYQVRIMKNIFSSLCSQLLLNHRAFLCIPRLIRMIVNDS
jgi:ribosome biogenesis protein BMS1